MNDYNRFVNHKSRKICVRMNFVIRSYRCSFFTPNRHYFDIFRREKQPNKENCRVSSSWSRGTLKIYRIVPWHAHSLDEPGVVVVSHMLQTHGIRFDNCYVRLEMKKHFTVTFLEKVMTELTANGSILSHDNLLAFVPPPLRPVIEQT